MSFDPFSAASVFITVCKEAIALKKWLTAKEEAFMESQLSVYELEIVRKTAGDPQGLVHLIPISGVVHVLAGGTVLGDSSPRERAFYHGAFRNLCERGFIDYVGIQNSSGQANGGFALTDVAYQYLDELKQVIG